MSFSIHIDEGQEIVPPEFLNEIKLAAQKAMADTFYSITIANFGESGEYRPATWQPLSERYAKRVGRTYATLELDGELITSIVPVSEGLEFSFVETNSPYARTHQFGDKSRNISARPFFPMDENEEITEDAASACMAQAEAAIEDKLQSA